MRPQANRAADHLLLTQILHHTMASSTSVKPRLPVIVCVDDDPQVLSAIRRDLRAKYREDFRIVAISSGGETLELLRELKQRGDNVALVLSDQRMPAMVGTELLARVKAIYPQAKRVLLTAYADVNAAVDAINRAAIDYYLTKPWDPPQEKLYPVLDDHLSDWQETYLPELRGIKVIGYRYDPRSHEIKDFLAGNQVPYNWIDATQDARAAALISSAKLDNPDWPTIIFEDGKVLQRPTIAAVAQVLGMNLIAGDEIYDVAIIGAGPAGLAAAVYGGSEGLKSVLIERRAPGGQAGTSSRIENYLGFPSGVSGADLSRRAIAQVQRFGVELLAPKEVNKIDNEGAVRRIGFVDGSELRTRSIVITTGVSYRMLPAAGAERFSGAGVYYGAATTEAASCQDQHVAVVGGGNSAGQGAVYLSRFARKVSIYIRRSDLSSSMSDYLIQQINAIENIDVVGYREVQEVLGDKQVEAIVLERLDTDVADDCYRQEVDSLFVFIGAKPHTEWLSTIIPRDSKGYLPTGLDLRQNDSYGRSWKLDREPFLLETMMPGVFAAGDVRAGAMNRVASAVGEGAMAIKFVHEYLAEV